MNNKAKSFALNVVNTYYNCIYYNKDVIYLDLYSIVKFYLEKDSDMEITIESINCILKLTGKLECKYAIINLLSKL